jgi:hypothetical protein
MTISKKEYYIIFLAFITLILLVIIFNWINYLSNNKYINYEKKSIEGFNSTYISDGHIGGSKTTNIPHAKPYKKYVPPENDAGKLTTGVTPTYSSLTTDIGTRANLFNSNTNIATPKLSNGVNTWMSNFNKGTKLFDSKFAPPQSQYMPVYNKKYSASGEFIDIGPTASNDYLI